MNDQERDLLNWDPWKKDLSTIKPTTPTPIVPTTRPVLPSQPSPLPQAPPPPTNKRFRSDLPETKTSNVPVSTTKRRATTVSTPQDVPGVAMQIIYKNRTLLLHKVDGPSCQDSTVPKTKTCTTCHTIRLDRPVGRGMSGEVFDISDEKKPARVVKVQQVYNRGFFEQEFERSRDAGLRGWGPKIHESFLCSKHGVEFGFIVMDKLHTTFGEWWVDQVVKANANQIILHIEAFNSTLSNLLAQVHELGWVHGDVLPKNIMMTEPLDRLPWRWQLIDWAGGNCGMTEAGEKDMWKALQDHLLQVGKSVANQPKPYEASEWSPAEWEAVLSSVPYWQERLLDGRTVGDPQWWAEVCEGVRFRRAD
jgi:hypothetical protein